MARRQASELRTPFKHSMGYVLVWKPGHPRAHNNYVYEHIFVWEQANGPLPEGWQVHHLNHQKDDNRLSNLQAMSREDHGRLHMTPERAREMQRGVVAARKRNGTYVRGPKVFFCKWGHPKTQRPNGDWVCKECHRLSEAERYRRKRHS